MDALYTKNGRPLGVSGNRIFNRDGLEVARLRSDRAYGPNGRYVGTVVNDRLIYRSTNSASISSPFSPSRRSGSARANRATSGLWGEEPPIP